MPSTRQNTRDEESDEALLAASAEDPAAFAGLVLRYERRLYGLLWKLCSQKDEIDDLYQQVWFKAWGARLTFEGRSKFGTWLYAIALNQVREWRRRQRPQVDIDSLPEAASPQPSALDRLLGRDRQRQVDEALRTLSEIDRRLLTLRYVQDLDYDEIAGLCRISLPQTRLKTFRALQRLRHCLTKDEL